MPKRDLAAALREFTYHQVPLAPFPGVPFTAAVEVATRRVYFAVDEICNEVGLHVQTQRERLAASTNLEGEPMVRSIPMWTKGGIQDKVSIEFQNIGQWLLSVQGKRTKDERAEKLRQFQRAALRAVDLVLIGEIPPIQIKLPNGRRSLLEQIEDRVSEAEREIAHVLAVQQAKSGARPAGGGLFQALATCPHCGGPILVQAGSLEVVAPAPANDTTEE